MISKCPKKPALNFFKKVDKLLVIIQVKEQKTADSIYCSKTSWRFFHFIRVFPELECASSKVVSIPSMFVSKLSYQSNLARKLGSRMSKPECILLLKSRLCIHPKI